MTRGWILSFKFQPIHDRKNAICEKYIIMRSKFEYDDFITTHFSSTHDVSSLVKVPSIQLVLHKVPDVWENHKGFVWHDVFDSQRDNYYLVSIASRENYISWASTRDCLYNRLWPLSSCEALSELRIFRISNHWYSGHLSGYLQ